MVTMQTTNQLVLSLLAVSVLVGCKTSRKECCPAQTTTAAAVAPTQAVAAPAVPAPVRAVIRIKAGLSTPCTDSNGNTWLADQGFTGGDVVERPDLEIANTKDPVLYRAEHYSMNSFSHPLPNGKYVVKLHFAETYDGVEGPG
jgi:hypothetical protein